MSTSHDMPSAATQGLPPDKAEIAREAVASTVCPTCLEQEERDLEAEIHSTRVNMDRANSELISTKAELKRTREELSRVNRELTEAVTAREKAEAEHDAMRETVRLWDIAHRLNQIGGTQGFH